MDKMNRQSFYFGALLHDIGKFIERAKAPDRRAKAKHWIDKGLTDVSYAHRRYGADFLDEMRTQMPQLLDEDVVRCALFHHRGKDPDKQDHTYLDQDVYVKMIRLADSLASAERTNDAGLEPQNYERAKLLSLFSRIDYSGQDKRIDTYIELNKLKLEQSALFPDDEDKYKPASAANEYAELVADFIREFQQVRNAVQLYYVMEKYLWAVPAQTPVEIDGRKVLFRPDVSLFDHSRVTAAIAMCLYDYYHDANEQEKTAIATANDNGQNLPPFALLLQIDLSGIQKFIFDIPSKGAAKSLKGRSFYLQLLGEIIARFVLDRLELPISNLLYDGGGNLFLLAPKSKEDKLVEIRKEIVRNLANAHGGAIYAAIGWTEVKAEDYQNFGALWKKATESTARIKTNRFQEINYTHVFEPQAPGAEMEFKEFTQSIRSMRAFALRAIEAKSDKTATSPLDVFKSFGYEVSFLDRLDSKGTDGKSEIYVLNSTEFLPKYSGFRFFAMNTPPKLEFDNIAEAATGDKKKLALLKMDVDNLGRIFIDGLPENERTISRLATLSRLFRLFFEGYLSVLCRELDPQANKIYVVYAGGDDTFIIGTWDVMFELAERIQKDFTQFTANNPDIHLSASLTIVHKHFPVIRAVALADESLDKAKAHLLGGEHEPKKNKITIFDQVFTWREFDYIKDFKTIIFDLIGDDQTGPRESRSLLQKIYNSTRGFSKLIEQTNNGRIHFPRFWRFAYYLRDMKTANKEQKEKLVEIYETVLKEQIYKPMNEKVHNPMIIPVAARWAELATKKTEERSA